MIKRTMMLLFGVLAPVYAQMYLITGSPMPQSSLQFPSELLQVGADGTVTTVVELAAQEPGATWITISYDLGIALVRSDRMVVLDLKKAKVVKTCRFVPGPPHTLWVYQWLLDTPSRGGVLAEEFAHWQDNGSELRGTLIDPNAECSKSYVGLEPADLRYIAAHGAPLIADAGGSDASGLNTWVDKDGELKGYLFSYGCVVPREHLAGLKQPFAGIGVNNSQVLLLSLSENGADYRLLALRKRDNTWHRVPLPAAPGDTSGRRPFRTACGFGHFIALVEAHPKDAQNRESAGPAEWTKGARKTGPDVAFMYQQAEVVFPGRLLLYDVETERSYTIATNQGDSEVVLVENDTVYYRASDRLYSVAIMESGLGRPHLIATADAIRDAHWAFVKH
jgi:hypothetical protein